MWRSKVTLPHHAVERHSRCLLLFNKHFHHSTYYSIIISWPESTQCFSSVLLLFSYYHWKFIFSPWKVVRMKDQNHIIIAVTYLPRQVVQLQSLFHKTVSSHIASSFQSVSCCYSSTWLILVYPQVCLFSSNVFHDNLVLSILFTCPDHFNNFQQIFQTLHPYSVADFFSPNVICCSLSHCWSQKLYLCSLLIAFFIQVQYSDPWESVRLTY